MNHKKFVLFDEHVPHEPSTISNIAYELSAYFDNN
jgi:hypothetical protein